MIAHIVEIILASVMVASAAMVVTFKHPIRSILALLICMMATSMVWLSLEAEFLALMLMIVHGGAVMTMFIYVSMTFVDTTKVSVNKLISCLVSLLILGLIWCGVLYYLLQSESAVATYRGFNTYQLGVLWVRDYPWPWMMLGVLLLVSMMGCVQIVYRSKATSSKTIRPSEVSAEDRLHYSPEVNDLSSSETIQWEMDDG